MDSPFPPGSPTSFGPGRNMTPIPPIPRAMNHRSSISSGSYIDTPQRRPSPPFGRPSPPLRRPSPPLPSPPLPSVPQAAIPEEEARMVIAVDYGTTFTGVAILSIKDREQERNPDLLAEEIRVIQQWPRNTTANKVPSDISYSPSLVRGCQQWGYDIDDHSRVIKWTKLALEETQDRTTELKKLASLLWEMRHVELTEEMYINNNMPRHLSKTPEDIVTDYLDKIAEKAYDEICTIGRNIPQRIPIDMVVTHPAKWSDRALNSTFRAIRSTFNEDRFARIRHVSFVTEPEACAHYTLRDAWQQDHVRFKKNDAFIVVDAGGGTVDLATYKISSIDYDTKQIKLEQIGKPIGRKCGATFIDESFLEFVKARLGKEDWDKLNHTDSKDNTTGGHNIVRPGVRVLQERFEPIKHSFDGRGEALGHPIQLPRGIGTTDDESRGIMNGALRIQPEDLREMFKSSVHQTLKLITQAKTQIDVKSQSRITLKKIFLSGGFAQSPYLLERVRQWGSTQSIDVERGGDCWAAVSRGAIIKSLGLYTDKLPIVRECPRHYGFRTKSQYEGWRHNHNSPQKDLEGTRWATGQIRWLVKKGDAIFPNKPIVMHYDCHWLLPAPRSNQNGRATGAPAPDDPSVGQKEVVFIASAEDDAPLRFDGLNTGESAPPSSTVLWTELTLDSSQPAH
ncbi:hypothetical protein OQA88_11223 [Cercophora sp. LCS_1]